ncbi:MAG: hypothetical protein Q4F53_05395 [Nesterenkonia sp.]|nr:hypothetical protein [Nesterenkonia sp.]
MTAPAADEPSPAVSLDLRAPDGRRVSAEFVDARWHELLDPPRYATVFGWALRAVPVVTGTALAAWTLDAVRSRRDRPWSMLLHLGLLLLGHCLSAAVMAAALVVVLVASVAPGFRLRFRRFMTETVGDAWLYSADHLIAEVLPVLDRALDVSLRRTDRTVLVGHSLGAELCRRLLAERGASEASDGDAEGDGDRAADVSSLWVGSGRTMLRMLRGSARRPGYAVGVLVQQVAALIGSSALLVGVLQADPRLAATAGAGLIGVLLTFWWTVVRGADTVGPVPDDAGGRVLAVSSPLDPIGAGFTGLSGLHRYIPVGRPFELLREHVTYWRKPETGTAVLQIAGVEGFALPEAPARYPWWTFLAGGLIAAAWAGAAQAFITLSGR